MYHYDERRLHGLQLSVESEKLGPVLARALNKKQVLILKEVSKNNGETATSLLARLSKERSLPLSTLKLNMKKLRELGLILRENSKPVKLTSSGILILKILGDEI